MDYIAALDALGEWAERTDSVRGVLVTGSAAAGDVHPLSDRDVEILVRRGQCASEALVTAMRWIAATWPVVGQRNPNCAVP
jgi:predicted nucleotidyltransferase